MTSSINARQNHSASRGHRLPTAIIGGLAVLLLVFGVPSAANAYSFESCKWPSGSVNYFPNVPSDYLTPSVNAASAWTALTDANLTRVSSYDTANFPITAGAQGTNGYDGVTTWTCNLVGTFQTVNIQLNRTYMDSYNSTLKKVITEHEIGHAMGLDHSSASGYPVMAPSAGNSYNHGTTTLTSDDIAGMNARY